MNRIPTPTSEELGRMMITDVLERWPGTVNVFHDHVMACVGCAVAPFFSINDAALVYGLSPESFVEELLEMIRSGVTKLDPTDE